MYVKARPKEKKYDNQNICRCINLIGRHFSVVNVCQLLFEIKRVQTREICSETIYDLTTGACCKKIMQIQCTFSV